MKEIIRELLGAVKISDVLVDFYFEKAKNVIVNYKNKDYSEDELIKQYGNQLAELTVYYCKNRNNTGDAIPSDIKASLGNPFIRLM